MKLNLRIAPSLGVVVATVLTLTGCASAFNPIGSNTYNCNRNQDPSSPYCHSFSAVEESTSGELPETRFDTELKLSDYDQRTNIAPVDEPKKKSTSVDELGPLAEIASSGAKMETPIQGAPVRIAPTIQRTLIKSFVDSDDDKVSDLIVYREVIPSHWEDSGVSNDAHADMRSFADTYPHREADSSQLAAAGPVKLQKPVSPRNDFIQPGSKTQNDESAVTQSMPQ